MGSRTAARVKVTMGEVGGEGERRLRVRVGWG